MKRLACSTALLLTLVVTPTVASAQHIEIETTVYGATSGSFISTHPGLQIGVILSDHVVLSTGISAHYMSEQYVNAGPSVVDPDTVFSSWGIGIPLEARLYITRPEAGAASPTLRFGVEYQHTLFSELYEWHGMSGHILGGVQYAITDDLGLAAEAGPQVTLSFTDGQGTQLEGSSIGLVYKSSLVLRI